MPENTSSIPLWHNGCIEEWVILDDRETSEVLQYTFSNSLDCIRTAIFSKTGHNIDLGKAAWKLNPKLSISVKHLMNHHNVNYSMTTYIRSKRKHVVINMRVGDDWFITIYEENDDKFINREFIDTCYKVIDVIIGMSMGKISSTLD